MTLLAPGHQFHTNRWLVVGAVTLALGLPLVDAIFKSQWQVLATGIGILVLLTLGLNVLLGVAGIIDLGFAVSFGIGGYLTGLLTGPGALLKDLFPQPLDLLVLLALAAGVAGAFGALKGRVLLGLRSDYLAVATLALGLLARRVIVNLSDVTGGAGGNAGPASAASADGVAHAPHRAVLPGAGGDWAGSLCQPAADWLEYWPGLAGRK